MLSLISPRIRKRFLEHKWKKKHKFPPNGKVRVGENVTIEKIKKVEDNGNSKRVI